MRPLRIMRVIPRSLVGEPARQASALMRGLDPRLFQQRLYVGSATSQPPTLTALLARVREFRPDVLHTHTGKEGDLGRIAAAIQGIPIRVHTFHEDLGRDDSPARSFGRTRRAAQRATQRALARRGDRLIAVSAKVRDRLLAERIGRPDQYEVIPPGVGLGPMPDHDDARRALGLAGRGPVVAFVGQVTAAKRLDRMLAVARELRTNVPDAQFVVCGEGEALTAVANESATHRLGVAFLGWRVDVETLYAAADVVLLTSDHEGMPACLIEAGLAARPVVATDVGSVAEVVRHGETGLLADPDVHSLTRCLERLLRDDGLRRRMGQAARVEAARRFGSERLVADLSEIYRQLAVERGRWPRPATAGPSPAAPTQGAPMPEGDLGAKIPLPAAAAGSPVQ